MNNNNIINSQEKFCVQCHENYLINENYLNKIVDFDRKDITILLCNNCVDKLSKYCVACKKKYCEPTEIFKYNDVKTLCIECFNFHYNRITNSKHYSTDFDFDELMIFFN